MLKPIGYCFIFSTLCIILIHCDSDVDTYCKCKFFCLLYNFSLTQFNINNSKGFPEVPKDKKVILDNKEKWEQKEYPEIKVIQDQMVN